MLKYIVRQTRTGRWSVVNTLTGLRVVTYHTNERAKLRAAELNYEWWSIRS